MVNRYRHVVLPSWTKNATKEVLIQHIQYLTSTLEVSQRALGSARYRMRKAEKELKELKRD